MPSLVKGKWTPEEDLRIEIAHRVFGPNWSKIASVFMNEQNESTRTMIQIRERWLNVLSQKFKLGGWSDEENELIERLVAENKQAENQESETLFWKKIASQLKRTAKQCKRHYGSLCRKKEK